MASTVDNSAQALELSTALSAETLLYLLVDSGKLVLVSAVSESSVRSISYPSNSQSM